MSCFIKDIFYGKETKEAHRQFIRFGKGKYENRAVLSIKISNKIKISGSFEYANDFVNLVMELGDFNFYGNILSKEKLDLIGKEKTEINIYEFKGNSEKLKEYSKKAYFMLLNVDSEKLKLKIKNKLPKPGKSGELKIDDKFCILEADLKYLDKIKDYFFWDLNNFKEAKISHNYEINQIIFPPNEKDFAKIRELAKRKGKIIRKIIVDKKEKIIEKEFEI
ncbi:MAG: hypothetical protein QW117_01660 [Candidatus Pacearchaeota archaeon]